MNTANNTRSSNASVLFSVIRDEPKGEVTGGAYRNGWYGIKIASESRAIGLAETIGEAGLDVVRKGQLIFFRDASRRR